MRKELVALISAPLGYFNFVVLDCFERNEEAAQMYREKHTHQVSRELRAVSFRVHQAQ